MANLAGAIWSSEDFEPTKPSSCPRKQKSSDCCAFVHAPSPFVLSFIPVYPRFSSWPPRPSTRSSPAAIFSFFRSLSLAFLFPSSLRFRLCCQRSLEFAPLSFSTIATVISILLLTFSSIASPCDKFYKHATQRGRREETRS